MRGGAYVVAQARVAAQSGVLEVEHARFEQCEFITCRATGGSVRDVEAFHCLVSTSGVNNLIIEDCVIDGLRQPPGGGGKADGFYLTGCVAHRLSLRGRFDPTFVMWSAPDQGSAHAGPWIDAAPYYEGMEDWALDVSEARFRSMPYFRYGPPGHLIRRDPDTQPLIDRQNARRMLDLHRGDLGKWELELTYFLAQPWLSSAVLVPGLGAPRRAYEQELAVLGRMRNAGAFEDTTG